MAPRKKNTPIGEPPTSHELVVADPARGIELTDDDKLKIVAYQREHPDLAPKQVTEALGLRNGAARRARLNDRDFELEWLEARGYDITRIHEVRWQVAVDTDHPKWEQANASVLKAYHPAFRDKAEVDVNHTGEVNSPDVTAAIDRFTALTAAAIRAAARTRTEPASLEPHTD